MSLASRKKVRSKKWSTVYCEKTAKPEEEAGPQAQSNLDFLANTWARAMLAKVLSKRIKEKVRQKSHSCKKSLINLHRPSAVSSWESHWGSQLMCDICHCPAIYGSIVCGTCDTIVHISCVDNDHEGRHEIIRQDETEEEEASVELLCEHCKDHFNSEDEYYRKELKRLRDERHTKLVVSRIAAAMKTYVARIRFLKKRRLAITMQSYLRRLVVRKKFTQMRRNQIRMVILDAVSLPHIEKASMLVWTVVDKFKNFQLFRMDKELSRSTTESFLIPGTSSNVSIFVSIVCREGQNFYIAAQAQLALRDVDPFEENQVHTLHMTENVQWVPQETRVERLNIQPPRQNAVDTTLYIDENGEPQTRPESLEERSGKVCQIRYNAVSTVTSCCFSIHGPPLDVLRRPAEIYQIASRNNANKNGGVPERKTKWWLCLVELNLLFYQYFGDTKPRFSIHIGEVSVTLLNNVAPLTSVAVLFPDKRKWTLDFDNPNDAKRFVFAVTESKKAMEGNSLFFKRPKQFRGKFVANL